MAQTCKEPKLSKKYKRTADACMTPQDIEMNVGSLHFKRETTEFYVHRSSLGLPVNVTYINALLYKPDGTTETVTIKRIATGCTR